MTTAASTISPAATPCIDWSADARPLAGQIELGDAYVVTPHETGALVAVIDGLGHGGEAAAAAAAAAAVLTRRAETSVINLLQTSHTELRKTRGAVLSIASFDASSNMMTWVGVGNVAGALFRADRNVMPARESLLLRSGVVGYQLPLLRAATLTVLPGDTLIFATDGIRDGFYEQSPLDRDPQEVAHTILSDYGKETDDALVLVVRYLGLQT